MTKSKHRQQQVTRRYIERTVQRARDEIIRAVLWATRPREPEDELPAVEPRPRHD